VGSGQVEAGSLLHVEVGDDLPLLAGVVDNRNVLLDLTTSRYSEFKLSLDLLRNSCELVLVQSNISAINGLQNDIASVRSRLGGVTVQLQQVSIRWELHNGSIILCLETSLRFLLARFA
jgi:hypothetical protein